MCLIRFLILNKHLYLSGVSLGVNPRANTQQTCDKMILDYMLKICILSIAGSIFNMIGGTYMNIY